MAEVVSSYIQQVQKFAPLSFEEEQALARQWREKHDERACHKLMQSYLRLVVKVAMGFRGYGLPVEELIQEGNVGLMQAIARFEPDRGFRLSTYAMWWIKASIQEYILNNWSMVKIGTSGTQKKLFFNLRRLRSELMGEGSSHMTPEAIKKIAKELNVNENDVITMDQRLRHGDESLNISLNDDDDVNEWQNFIPDTRASIEERYGAMQIGKERQNKLKEAIGILDDRERDIFIARRLTEEEKMPTLEDLSRIYGVSRERVRQLEERAYKKVQKHITQKAIH
ncbi:MAG TPA: RNA polymerase sigma factor RpoH [Alphaproteobacteria bacterium]|nr:RNA polymerase sigma factor RpoH [Alphaproteobacteria bacterium]